MRRLEELHFINSYARLPAGFHSRIQPQPLAAPRLAASNPQAAALIDLSPEELARPQFSACLNGEWLPPGAEPLAAVYAGHQFGQYVPQLGDGRAILLGEVEAESGRWELQLKGAGITPYSRRGDGRAVLRSTIREYLCSEAMHGLGIPTTRALALIDSEEEVYRESIERGAVLLRMAPSHLRFGHFEFFYYRNDPEALRILGDYALREHFPHLLGEAHPFMRLFEEVTARTAELMAHWQLVGFAHGVMNTDNMSLLGLTIDYGPFGFLDAYDPDHICNHSDVAGRYAFGAQPRVGGWNLSRLGQALMPLFEGEPGEAAERANAALKGYESAFQRAYAEGMNAKLGLISLREGDGELAKRLLRQMHADRVDYTRLFRALGALRLEAPESDGPLRDQFLNREAFDAWAADYRARLRAEGSEDAQRRAAMDAVNPKYILRNHLAQRAIELAEQERDYTEIERLHQLLQRPFDEQPAMEAYAAEPPEWAEELAISCSS